MNKKRGRGSYRNPVPFLNDGSVVTHKRLKKSKESRKHKEEYLILCSGMSSKILKEAQNQQKEIDDEEENTNVFTQEDEETYEEEVDDFDAFLEMHKEDEANKVMKGMINEYEEENEKLLDRFLSKEEDLPDFILETIKKKDWNVTSAGARPLLEMDTHYVEIFKGVAQFMKTYTAGKITKPFKFIPSMKQQWEDALKLTEPEKWSPHAMYGATRILASNLSPQAAERFYKFVLLPRVREDIRKNRRLHFALYQSLKKSVYKHAVFFKGILLPLCQLRTCTSREALVVGSIITKVRIPVKHAGAALMMLAQMEFSGTTSAALMMLAQMEFSGTTSYFIKLLLEKKFALQYRVIEALVAHFMGFLEEPRIMPVIWHQSLLAFAQSWCACFLAGIKEDKDKLINLLEAQNHHEVTPEIRRELFHSRNRGEKEDDILSIDSPMSVFNTPVKEDMFDIPEVPMEDD